ncbi:tRNA lysidine(34) synthetase TilS [bacterium]|jgi:tRNA(Ile)-lysidine synthase|nr:tRNA lysidine(34) synthetase TilS [bacterium]MBT6831564.1 tRNA lysidine(34) synthetase TilS [bacterium]MBT6996702.1 tRNA lysidine(34) synthetase TilS [bacterium]MBT7772108.1 tRNA lysidine(34) synthetase TilS [bacterium]
MKNLVESAFQNFIARESLAEKKIVLMISGGVDSTVLLHVAAKFLKSENLAILHVNHKTRAACDAEQIFVEKMCKKLSIKFFVQKLAKLPQKNQESWWRAEREKCKTDVLKKFGATRALTAHHATDLAETMIWRLTKGCGVSGLSPFEISTKPFWEISKSEIEKYARAKKLSWCEDFSNLNTNFERNLIRHEILPVLRKVTPNLEKVCVAESKIFGAAANFLETKLPEISENKILLTNFLALPEILQTEFLRKIARQIPSSSEIDDCLRWLQNSPQGGTQKTIGGTPLAFRAKILSWK